MPALWFHGASVGDVRALSPLVAAIERERPDLDFCVSAITCDGQKRAEQLYGSHARRAPWFTGRAFDAAHTRVLILEYLELWPHAIAAASRRKIPIVIVDGHITQKSLRFRALLRRFAQKVDLFCAQSEQDADCAERLGFRKVVVTGNGKFDLPMQSTTLTPELADGLGKFDCVLGSLHPDEEDALFAALPEYTQHHRLLCAPRYLHRVPNLLKRARDLHLNTALRSQLDDPQTRPLVQQAAFVILDSLGELAATYALAPAAIIGGSFGKREGQNMIEAARLGCFLIHGPHTQNIALEAACFKSQCQVTQLSEALEKTKGAQRCDHSSDLLRLQGATKRQLSQIRPFLPPSDALF